MMWARPSSRILTLIVALCLQAQALAAVLLPCSHELAAGSMPAPHACHGDPMQHIAEGHEALECEKCNLVMAFSAYDLPPMIAVSRQLGLLPSLTVTAEGHFYRHTPETPYRPPKPAL